MLSYCSWWEVVVMFLTPQADAPPADAPPADAPPADAPQANLTRVSS